MCSNMADHDLVDTSLSAAGLEASTSSCEIGSAPKLKTKMPKRILHFSDGVLEEYSSDDSDDSDEITIKVDPSSLDWGPWCLYYVTGVAQKTLSVADYCGERLAWFLGITTPKYQYAITEHNRIQKEIEMEKVREDKLEEEMEGISSIDIQIVGGKQSKELRDMSNADEPEKY